jgi:hypothetical protein
MTVRSAAALLLVALTAGCDLSSEFDSAGTFTGTVSGDINATLEGTALFGSFIGGEFSLAMTDPRDQHAIAVARNEGRPAVGVFSIAHFEEETGIAAAYARDGAPAAVFQAEGGEIQITSSSASRLQGTLMFDAVGYLTTDPDTELHVTVTATFDARCVRTGGTDCR